MDLRPFAGRNPVHLYQRGQYDVFETGGPFLPGSPPDRVGRSPSQERRADMLLGTTGSLRYQGHSLRLTSQVSILW